MKKNRILGSGRGDDSNFLFMMDLFNWVWVRDVNMGRVGWVGESLVGWNYFNQ